MKRVLIISPYFPPSNAADMQRVRMSLPYFRDHGWDAEVVVVDPAYSEVTKDQLLLESIPEGCIIHQVKAFDKKWTGKFGLGSLALRSLWFYRQKVNLLLRSRNYDLIYFSTTQFPLCILGAYWKKKFKVPYVIDMQDPWHSEYYQNKPKSQQPPKYWFSYGLNKWLEPMAMRHVGGLISVSEQYIKDLKTRYIEIKNTPAATITFGAFLKDWEIAKAHCSEMTLRIKPLPGKINVVYIGRGGYDMHKAIKPVFEALSRGLRDEPAIFSKFHFYFLGTSYATAAKATATISPLAGKLNVSSQVTEETGRIGFYESLATLLAADVLFIPGSDDPKYTASKIYPYLMSLKPLLSVIHEESNAVEILKRCSPNTEVFTFSDMEDDLVQKLYDLLRLWSAEKFRKVFIEDSEFEKYSAGNMTRLQCKLFDEVISLN